MATPEANLTGVRGSSEVSPGHAPPPRHLHNFNTFQFVSQLVSATPPYLFNMSAPFPGNFFSDLLRRMAPRAGTPGLPPDQTLQQHIRAALLAKSAPPPPPSLPPTVMPPPLDLAAATHRTPAPPPSLHHDKGLKRSLFSDVSALSSSEDSEGGAKRPRLESEGREADQHPPEGLPAPFLMQAPFLHSSVPPPHDVLNPWSARASLLRPQVPLAAHVPPTPLDPYRLLLDLRLAGQLRTMAATQALHNKDASLGAAGGGGGLGLHPPVSSSHSSLSSSKGRSSPPLSDVRPPRDDPPPATAPTSVGVLQAGEDRVSAFHPPARPHNDPADTSDEEAGERRSCSRSSSGSASSAREGLGPQYIFKHLTQIYRTIDGHKVEGGGDGGEEPRLEDARKELLRPGSPEQNRAVNRCGDGQHEIRSDVGRDDGRTKEG
ncbi:uncharacterized protein [Penaeus vannamei]|uniref:uncharacterized protein n=1 Tax=Penaeus vannamei TaxID=6689 RepID=UPI00387FA63E